MQGRQQRGRTRWLTLRVRTSERERLRAAAQKAGKWDSELAREAINERVNAILAGGRERVM